MLVIIIKVAKMHRTLNKKRAIEKFAQRGNRKGPHYTRTTICSTVLLNSTPKLIWLMIPSNPKIEFQFSRQ